MMISTCGLAVPDFRTAVGGIPEVYMAHVEEMLKKKAGEGACRTEEIRDGPLWRPL